MTGFHERVLVLRVDAGIEIGMGHLMRCTALARAWQKSGGAVVFLSWFEEEVLREHLRRESFPVLPISSPHPAGEDLAETLRVLHDNESRHCGKALLALDGYHFDGTYQQALAGSVERLLVVDDTVRLPYYHADMILNQNLGAEALSYPCDADTVKLLGLRYVLLRPQFAEFMDWRRDAPERARRILVSMGGSDPDNVTSFVLEALGSLDPGAHEVIAVIGPANPNREAVEKAAFRSRGMIRAVFNPPDLPRLMQWADLGVTAAGSTCWEMAFMMLPMITLVLAQNQEIVARGLDEAGAAEGLGDFREVSSTRILESVTALAGDKVRRERMGIKGRELVDGLGADRVVHSLAGC